jgi:type II secretory pathway pseudopilin PulG
MIGVLAVIAILAAMVAPKIFKVISDSQTTRVASESRTYASAVADWYKDVRTLRPLDAAGATLVANDTAWHTQLTTPLSATAGLWARWAGPYIDGAPQTAVGTSSAIENCASAGAAPSAANCSGVDFDFNNSNDVTVGSRVVWQTIVGASLAEFNDVDRIIDGAQGANAAQRQARGRVKYDTATSTMRVYLASD